jgi:hypothetical protein
MNEPLPGPVVYPYLPKARSRVNTKSIEYPQNSQTGNLIKIPETNCLARAVDLKWRPTELPIISDSSLLAIGFRTYLTRDGFVFNDQTCIEGFDFNTYARDLLRMGEGLIPIIASPEGLSLNIPKERKVIDTPVYSLLSDEPSNYGSWIYRILPKLIEWKEFGALPILVWQNSQWMNDLVSIVTGQAPTIVRYNPGIPYELSSAIIPSMRNYGVYFDKATLNFLRNASASIVPNNFAERLYLARGAGRRSVVNEAAVVALLEDRGFAAIQPAKLSIHEQIAIIKQAKVIICPGGAGLFNLPFALNCACVIDIEPGPHWVSAHHSLIRSCGIDHVILFGTRKDPTAHPHSSWEVNLEALKATLDYLDL